MKVLFILGVVAVLGLGLWVMLRPPAGGFDGRTLLALVLAVLLVLSAPVVSA
ncbi:hypothetical protein SEA_LITTLETOKYO_49 [Arthrobacter phage LittleTokyo]|nr:hypothetical protein SEA_LITTLETOKYO_49 [Arthrobacter phage LittleTokyo]